eukprot:CAMPEP_0179023944 /NCGR_PEP_ID=MMETSP0796-20121207/7198_1 /TAXON_ID=73915 /ORGANISM="Pyrodinium bahamense, Strain pbaha01" /LENGTH=218 /DNA_ID=CAMNT_0020719885 /DNA_START=66 /DNA_END=720 /DNA_ORIENTATION=-
MRARRATRRAAFAAALLLASAGSVGAMTERGCTCKCDFWWNGRWYDNCTDADLSVLWCTVQKGCGNCDGKVKGTGCWDVCTIPSDHDDCDGSSLAARPGRDGPATVALTVLMVGMGLVVGLPEPVATTQEQAAAPFRTLLHVSNTVDIANNLFRLRQVAVEGLLAIAKNGVGLFGPVLLAARARLKMVSGNPFFKHAGTQACAQVCMNAPPLARPQSR